MKTVAANQRLVARKLSHPASGKRSRNSSWVTCIVGRLPGLSSSAEITGRRRTTASDPTISCQRRCSGRLAPSTDIEGHNARTPTDSRSSTSREASKEIPKRRDALSIIAAIEAPRPQSAAGKAVVPLTDRRRQTITTSDTSKDAVQMLNNSVEAGTRGVLVKSLEISKNASESLVAG